MIACPLQPFAETIKLLQNSHKEKKKKKEKEITGVNHISPLLYLKLTIEAKYIYH